MLDELEMQLFLERLLGFIHKTKLPVAQAGKLFGVTPVAVSRWMRGKNRAARWTADSVDAMINILDRVNMHNGLYRRVAEAPKNMRVDMLRDEYWRFQAKE